ncbi:helix-turn-helix domain-containing protein [Acidaminobacter sp. JC074]|uniref:helix-turn-helix domain-containing protein n=1 Tax=Acidaminobacter sp. JC074 TaxID=2530199 RepID=UPI001F0FFF68|nr:helix-turn-helix domain-containing protein [Acidaminobacter sp. JC074]MCH4888962.1 helix-turn-helix domain-containing protein [Acidaminobacter sp. JC074]
MFIGNLKLNDLLNSPKISDMLLRDDSMFQEHAYSNATHHPFELEKELYAAIIEGDVDQVEEVGRKYNEYHVANLCKNNTIRSLKNNLICSCALITRVAIQSGLNERYAYFLSDLYINKIESLISEDAIVNLNSVMILDFMSQIKKGIISKEKHYSELTNEAISYIEKNLCKQITLQDVSTSINVNNSYLSRVFNKDTGMSFSQYVHESRIKKAKHLLLFSDSTLIEISTKLGYCTQSYFNKTFKKFTGHTPMQFKEMNLNIRDKSFQF